MTALERALNKIIAIKEANTGMDFIPNDYGLGVTCSEGYFFYANAEEILKDKSIEPIEYHGKESEYAEKHCKMYLNVLRKFIKDTESTLGE
jgi:hypothetical protein